MTNRRYWYYSRKRSGWLWNLNSKTNVLFNTNPILLFSIVDLKPDRAAAIDHNANRVNDEVFYTYRLCTWSTYVLYLIVGHLILPRENCRPALLFSKRTPSEISWN